MGRMTMLVAVVVVLSMLSGSSGSIVKVPKEYFYTSHNTESDSVEQGCHVRRWKGMDPEGTLGYPYVATIECPAHTVYTAEGWAEDPLHFYVWDGKIAVNGTEISLSGSSSWVNAGAWFRVRIEGKAYVVGGPFALRPDPAAYFTDAYDGTTWRVFDVADAAAGKNNATMLHDPHINNGTEDNNCKDLAWAATPQHVDPAAITVVNCAATNVSFVADHYHPMGSLYLPYSGRICFFTPDKRCSEPGFPRWTSPILRYYETFEKNFDSPPSPAIFRTVNATGPWRLPCEYPIVFSVTHFDLFSGKAGVPNFDDTPIDHSKVIALRRTQHTSSLVSYDTSCPTD